MGHPEISGIVKLTVLQLSDFLAIAKRKITGQLCLFLFPFGINYLYVLRGVASSVLLLLGLW